MNLKVTKGTRPSCPPPFVVKLTSSRFHCEGRALRTIFGLLFWDIIFASVPGAFETPFQTAPLDISHETFYTSRLDLIERRLQDIREGKAREILEATDTKYRENAAWCVGVDWGTFGRQDLLEIVDVSSRRALTNSLLLNYPFVSAWVVHPCQMSAK